MDEQKEILTRIRDFQESIEGVEILKKVEGYGYDYADLKVILEVIKPKLKENGIWFQHFLMNAQDGSQIVQTIVYNVNDSQDHVMAETILDKEATLPKQNDFQKIGSGITYFRRYHLTALLGLTFDEDNDAGGKREKPIKKSSSSNKRQAPAIATKTEGEELVDQFKMMIEKGRPKAKVEKNLNTYKSKLTNDQIKQITNLIKDNYED